MPPHPQGLQTYDDFFDGRFSKGLAAAGGNLTNHYPCAIMHHPASGIKPWLRNPALKKENIPVAICTRHVFETTARQLVAENPKVQFVYGQGVTGLLMSEREGSDVPQRVTGEVVDHGVVALCRSALTRAKISL